MSLLLKKYTVLFYIAVLPAVILFSVSCRHETPVLKEQVSRLPDKTRSFESFSVDYEDATASLIFSRQVWTQSEDKVNIVDTGIKNRTAYGSPCSDFWMEYSLWNGQPRKHLMVLAIPPLFVYPIIDTVILAGCMVCDCCIFPFSWIDRQISSQPVVLAKSENAGNQEIVSEFKIDQNLSYRNVIENRTSSKLSSQSIDVNDKGVRKTIFTDSQGRIKTADLTPWLFPIRNISFSISGNVGGEAVTISTYRFLNQNQKQLWDEIKKKDSPARKKLEAWEKLRPVSEPKYFKQVKSNIENGHYF